MANLPNFQLDYIFFIYGLSFFVLAAVCFFLWKLKYSDFPWVWLGLFGVVHGVNEWFDLVSVSIYDSFAFSAVRLLTLSISFLFLFEFARRGYGLLSGKLYNKGIYLILLISVLLGGIFGLNGIHFTSRYFLGFLSSAFAGISVYN